MQFREFGSQFGLDISDGNDDNDNGITDAEAYSHKVITTARAIAESMASLTTLINEAPENIRERPEWTDCLERIKAICSHKGSFARLYDTRVSTWDLHKIHCSTGR